jgi:hypothetical protein
MATRVDIDIATAIESAIGSLTIATNLFYGPRRAVGEGSPAKAVFVVLAGGPPPQAFLGSTTVLRESSVQIIVRSSREDYDDGLDLAQEVQDAVHYAPIAGYKDVRVNDAQPVYLDQDEAGFHEWSMTATAWHEEAA